MVKIESLMKYQTEIKGISFGIDDTGTALAWFLIRTMCDIISTTSDKFHMFMVTLLNREHLTGGCFLEGKLRLIPICSLRMWLNWLCFSLNW